MANDDSFRPRVYGSTVVSTRGQVVIPANARKEIGINSGDTLLVCGPAHGQGLLLLKMDAVEGILSMMSEQMATVERVIQDHKSPRAASRQGRRVG